MLGAFYCGHRVGTLRKHFQLSFTFQFIDYHFISSDLICLRVSCSLINFLSVQRLLHRYNLYDSCFLTTEYLFVLDE